MSKQLTKWLAVIMLMSVFLTACSSTKQTIQYEGDSKMQATITVKYSGGEEVFNFEYGNLFRAKYPNIDVKLINNLEDEPDVLLLGFDEYGEFLDEGKLYDLNNVITDEAFKLEGMNQGVIDVLKERGRGKLYGLPPQFSNRALFYNKDLFDKYTIPYPTDGMTWEEVLQLAKRFPIEDGEGGLYTPSLGSLLSNMEEAKDLRRINTKDMKVTVNTDSYKELFETILDASESQALNIFGHDGFAKNDPFITGQSAMAFEYYTYLNNNIYWVKQERGEDFNLNWDVVTAPVDKSNREATPYFFIPTIFAVNAKAQNVQAAWEFVKFVNGEEFATINSRTTTNNIPTRTDYVFNPEGKRMEAFFSNLKMNRTLVSHSYYENIPISFLNAFHGIVESELKAAAVGVKTIDEALVSIEERGQQQLDKQLAEKSVEEGK
ncbi:multiple sugar transport system substrate-binding protein [Fontibacillus panacisegetis]|uniref:Multiple sugar transport system substrate-binding protein n=1 Tax=Fontibacillus panacisegetis TaxID=670482 RepID=A0A1G7PQ11_9BACL|nr:extracellular solute-binding protein [Fontibacillus panacisegetis]SDF88346.1 multiple sugar transport system substrate-binding protein [Fontibacillus panacisegetis]